ncbi:MAG: MerR family transcriptional regulator [Abitibacteriaceae bacterium]|nr:MerR family transcriptional regulator [Abditibacteriaceae bacterium]MBV9868676.1 MerR family transcriptional regulator [Abditibacteriaceae bacterium]
MDNTQKASDPEYKHHGYNIKVVARRTGLSPHVIRVWERRYRAVEPARSATARRLYTDAEIERLLLLRQATQAGHSIGQIANLPTPQLAELVADDKAAGALLESQKQADWPRVSAELAASDRAAPVSCTAAEYIEKCAEAVEKLDTGTLESLLAHASVTLGSVAMMEQVAVPLLKRIGDCWRQGVLRISHEHLATAIIRTFLGTLHGGDPGAAAPVLLVTTPAGQLHEIGALMAATTAAAEGWKVTYLGPNLPVEEIAAATLHTGARAVALSIVYPSDDIRLHDELKKLRAYVPNEVLILAGGRAAEAYDQVLAAIGAVRLDDMLSFRSFLETVRKSPPAPSSSNASATDVLTSTEAASLTQTQTSCKSPKAKKSPTPIKVAAPQKSKAQSQSN